MINNQTNPKPDQPVNECPLYLTGKEGNPLCPIAIYYRNRFNEAFDANKLLDEKCPISDKGVIRLKEEQEKNELTNKQVSIISGLKDTYNNLKYGKISMVYAKAMLKLSDEYGCSPEYLLGCVDDRNGHCATKNSTQIISFETDRLKADINLYFDNHIDFLRDLHNFLFNKENDVDSAKILNGLAEILKAIRLSCPEDQYINRKYSPEYVQASILISKAQKHYEQENYTHALNLFLQSIPYASLRTVDIMDVAISSILIIHDYYMKDSFPKELNPVLDYFPTLKRENYRVTFFRDKEGSPDKDYEEFMGHIYLYLIKNAIKELLAIKGSTKYISKKGTRDQAELIIKYSKEWKEFPNDLRNLSNRLIKLNSNDSPDNKMDFAKKVMNLFETDTVILDQAQKWLSTS